jgi:hypothetical protein
MMIGLDRGEGGQLEAGTEQIVAPKRREGMQLERVRPRRITGVSASRSDGPWELPLAHS